MLKGRQKNSWVTEMYRRIAQAWRDGGRERVEVVQQDLKLMSEAKGNKKDF